MIFSVNNRVVLAKSDLSGDLWSSDEFGVFNSQAMVCMASVRPIKNGI